MKDRIMNTLLELVAVPGIAGTDKERETAEKIYKMLGKFEYFKKNKDNLKIIDVKDDPLNRSFVLGFFKSKKKTKKTIIITGHLDVVNVDEFGDLKDLAFNPLELKGKVKELCSNKEALEDYESGDWLFGRGTADMKFGLSLHMELLRDFSEDENFEGNIIFLAVPGEESNSEGMLAAVPYLYELKEKEQLEYIGLFVSECCIPKESRDDKKRIYLGSAGKVMPLFFCVGKETHVYESFTGLNPNLLTSEINRLMELNPSLCDKERGNTTPPPICLKQMDLKDLYSVQTPLYAATYYNILTLNLNIDDLMKKLREIALEAFKNSLELVNYKVEEFSKASNSKIIRDHIETIVVSYEELYNEVLKVKGESFKIELEEKIKQWKNNKMDLQTIAINIMKETYENYQDKKPMIIIGFAPPYYPDKHLIEEKIEDKKLLEAVEEVTKVAKEKYNTIIELDHYYMGLSDLSYTGVEDKDGLEKICSNILGINNSYSMPVEELKKLNIPSVVFGGLGKDFHKCTERVNISYSFEIVPKLYKHCIENLFKKSL